MTVDIYNAAAAIVDSAIKKEGSLKHLCYSSRYQNKKKLFALVFQTVKYKKILEKVAAETKHIWIEDNVELCMSLKLVLLYETVLGKGVSLQCQFHDTLRKCHASIMDSFQNISEKYPHLLKESKRSNMILPRYVRVNTLKTDTKEVIEVFIDDGYMLAESQKPSELSHCEFMKDEHVPNLLVFNSSVDLHSHVLYKDGKILLQDKASCLPAYILDPPPRSFIIDACAAPGNKTSHLASIIGNEGVVYSFDMDKKRFQVMNKLLAKSNASCVKTKLQDFLKVKHVDSLFSKVEYILVDPSCSGSGIVSRMDELVDEVISDVTQKARLKGLSGFQTAALSHALSFPNVKKVVYSTCSVHKEENEDVVEKACKRFASTFSLVDILPDWKNRGIGQWEEADKCIRAIPEIDHTNGFFVAMFERVSKVQPRTQDSEDSFVTEVVKTNVKVEPKLSKAVKRKKETDSENKVSENQLLVFAPFSVSSKKRKRRKDRVKKPVTS